MEKITICRGGWEVETPLGGFVPSVPKAQFRSLLLARLESESDSNDFGILFTFDLIMFKLHIIYVCFVWYSHPLKVPNKSLSLRHSLPL